MAYRLIKSSVSAVLMSFLLFANTSVSAADEAKFNEGKKIFKSNCASCHNKNKDMTGPALVGIGERVEYEWFTKWVRNNAALRASGDVYANEIYSKWNGAAMNTFPALKDAELDAMWEYLNVPDPVKGPAAAGADAGEDPCETEADVRAAEEEDGTLPALLWLGVLFLAVIVVLIGRIANRVLSMGNAVKDGDDLVGLVKELDSDKLTFKKIIRTKGLMIPIVLVLLAIGGERAWNFHSNLGRQHVYGAREYGYKPDQPIAFSHKIHAGINKIPCQYCHSGAKDSKMSMVPSLSLCMNCHTAINEYSSCEDVIFTGGSGTEEMHKIYKYQGLKNVGPTKFEPMTDEEKEELYAEHPEFAKPIEWVRIHNLPEHVYFNHAQHVSAGKIECQECHGPVQEWDVVEQHSPLSMGWCVNCHRETEVKFASNGFYQDYQELHDKLNKGELDKVTVESIGGTDCQRCHY